MILKSESEMPATEIAENMLLQPPAGWVSPGDPMILKLRDFEKANDDHDSSVTNNLPLAAEKVEMLIDRLYLQLGIPVPLSYLRIDEATSFHVLLLISRGNFTSPKIHAARFLAEQFMYNNNTFDVHCQFTVQSENLLIDSILAKGYRLMHIQRDLHIGG
jgi:hypothetical protein